MKTLLFICVISVFKFVVNVVICVCKSESLFYNDVKFDDIAFVFAFIADYKLTSSFYKLVIYPYIVDIAVSSVFCFPDIVLTEDYKFVIFVSSVVYFVDIPFTYVYKFDIFVSSVVALFCNTPIAVFIVVCWLLLFVKFVDI